MRRSSMLWVTGAAVLIASVLSSTAGAARHGQTYVVNLQGFTYSPASVTIHRGDSVRWTYTESTTTLTPGCESLVFQTPVAQCPGHSVTSTATKRGRPVFDSGVHHPWGYPFEVRFTTAGTFTYFCTVHGGAHPNNPLTHMDGTVIVRP